MKGNRMLIESAAFILIGGSVLFCMGYFSSDRTAISFASFTGILIGYMIYVRIDSWSHNGQPLKVLYLFGVTLLMSTWASLCLLIACNAFSNSPLCIENKRSVFVVLIFFFPFMFVFFGWLYSHFLQTRR